MGLSMLHIDTNSYKWNCRFCAAVVEFSSLENARYNVAVLLMAIWRNIS